MPPAPASPSGERRVITALFCDVVGSTSIAETMDPEDWSDIVASAIETMGNLVGRYGGTVAEFAGDGILALFGAPVAHEDDPYRAARAGMDIAAAIPALDGRDQLQVRVGIHTGLVVVGDLATGERSTYSALGDTLNVAARLQSVADPSTVVVSGDTRRLLGSDAEAEMIGPVELKGRKAPVVVYRITGLVDVERRHRGLPGLTSPIVGREGETDTLRGLVAAGGAGTGRAAAILGDPGVGKSRLVDELRREDVGQWVVGTCVAFDDELPYHLAASLVRSMAEVGSSEPIDVVDKVVDELTDRLGVVDHAPVLKRLVGVPDDTQSIEPPGHEYTAAVTAILTALTRSDRPVVIVCEDAHWADQSSIDLLTDLLPLIPTLPVLLLLVMRPDRDTPGWGLLEHARRRLGESFTEMRLEPLDETASRMLVSNLLEIESLPPTLRRLVLEKSEGNPFFVEEVVRMLIESGLVENRDGRWVAREEVGELSVPETIDGLLASRVDMLGQELRRAGRVASVIGRRFAARLFDEVYDEPAAADRGSLHPHLGGLEAHGMIRVEEIEPELEFGFRHALIHDVMYRGLLRKERRDLHRSVAEAIERVYPDSVDELSPALARHYAEAGAGDEAITYYFRAGRQARAKGARVEAARFFAQAQALLEDDPDSDPAALVDAVIGRVGAGMAFIPGPEAIGLIESVLPRAEALGDADRLARLYERLIWTRGMQGETYASPEYRSLLKTGYALIPELTDSGTASLLHAMMGGALRSDDEYEASIEPLTRAVDGLESNGRLSEASYNASILADSLSQIGRFAEAMMAVERARDLGERSGDPNAVLDADLIRGSIAADRGDLEEALEYTRRGIEGAEQHGNTFCNLAGNFKLADQQLRLGEVDSAIEHLVKSTGLAQYCNAGGYEVLGQAWLARARSKAGDPRPEDFEKPLSTAIASGSRSSEGLVRMQRAITLAESGEPQHAWADFERAVELFDDYGGRPNLARAHHAYGQALEAAGRMEDALAHLRTAEDLFEELGIAPDEANWDGAKP